MRGIAVIALAWLAAVLVTVGAPPAHAAQGDFGSQLGFSRFARAMTVGPDGDIWFAASGSSSDLTVGKVGPDGDITEYEVRIQGSFHGPVSSIVTGPDDNLWFVGWSGDAIGRSTTEGDATAFSLASGSRPTAIAAGPDGNLWFTEGAASAIGRIADDGTIAEFALPPERHPSDIAAGPDGNLWFTEQAADRIGRITTSGEVTEFPIPGPRAKPSSIALGSDGNLWFTDRLAPRIGRITPAGQITLFVVPTVSGTDSIVGDSNGRLWFAARYEIGGITTAGKVLWPACPTDSCEFPPVSMAVGMDGALWVGLGPGHCPSLCGGGTEISYLYRPGEVGRYELPSPTLAIGPRAAPVRRDRSSLVVVCGLAGGCRGSLRLVILRYRDGEKRFPVVARGRYRLAAGTARRIRLRVARWALRYLRHIASDFLYVRALAGPGGSVQADRGAIKLRLSSRAGRSARSRSRSGGSRSG